MRNSQQQRTSRDWRAGAFSGLRWEADPARATNPGGAGGFFVYSEPGGHFGYLKPTAVWPDTHPCAANEKIVADLGHEAGLRIPPVQLYTRDPCPAGQESRTCVSLVMYDEVHEWSAMMNLQGPVGAVVRASMARDCGIIALDTLIGNTDRNNGRNALFGVDAAAPAEGAFVFLDSANSLNMGNRWDNGNWKTVDVPPMPDLLRNSVDVAILSDAIDQISAVTDAVIEEIVNRIPDAYMVPDHKRVVVAGLKGRRTLVRPKLKEAFPGLA